MKRFIDDHLSLIKAVLFVLFGVVAVFVGIEGPLTNWTWLIFAVLAVALVGLEIYHHRQDKAPPRTKLRKYLLDYDGWEKTSSIDYYIADPGFTISPLKEDAPLDYQQEWTRGEIGFHYDSGNTAYYAGAFKNELLLQKIHVVIFDGGKKIAVAPEWEAIGGGRFYFYLRDSINYAYQCYLSRERGKDHSRGIRRADTGKAFDIPILKNRGELERFITYCDEPVTTPATKENKQLEIFYSLLEKHQTFRQGGLS